MKLVSVKFMDALPYSGLPYFCPPNRYNEKLIMLLMQILNYVQSESWPFLFLIIKNVFHSLISHSSFLSITLWW